MTKTIEECGELIQVLAKKISYIQDGHKYADENIDSKIEEEIGDVMAGIRYIIMSLDLDPETIDARMNKKYKKYENWG